MRGEVKVTVSIRPAPDAEERLARLAALLLGPGARTEQKEDNEKAPPDTESERANT